MKNYQKTALDTPDSPGAFELAVPEQVSVAMAEITADMREGLLALAVGAGLQVMAAMMDADVVALAGPKGLHDGERTAVRHGREAGSVTLGGRRVRSIDRGSGPATAAASCRSRRMNCSVAPRSSGASRWRRCSPG